MVSFRAFCNTRSPSSLLEAGVLTTRYLSKHTWYSKGLNVGSPADEPVESPGWLVIHVLSALRKQLPT